MRIKGKWDWYDWAMCIMIGLMIILLVGSLAMAFLGITYIGFDEIRFIK